MRKHWSWMWKYWSQDMELLVPQMWKYWSLDVEVLVPGWGTTGPWMVGIEPGDTAGGVREHFWEIWKLAADCTDKTVACRKLWIVDEIPLKLKHKAQETDVRMMILRSIWKVQEKCVQCAPSQYSFMEGNLTSIGDFFLCMCVLVYCIVQTSGQLNKLKRLIKLK